MATQLPIPTDAEAVPVTEDVPRKLSKNQQKKLKRNQEWEANRVARKAKRREKIQEKKQAKRAAREEAAPTELPAEAHVQEIVKVADKPTKPKRTRPQFVQLPVTLLLDCDFDDLMMEKELRSLTAQITRCYSDNNKAPYQAHLTVSSFGGHLKERFDGVLNGNYHSWRNVRFREENFAKVSDQANQWMRGPEGGKLAGMFSNSTLVQQGTEGQSLGGEVVYLTSDSQNTLTELRPYSTYIIGGLVDRNRHKGICYKAAMDKGVKTAKLPIGNYMKMNSRFVLATNHVVEIMLRWLEFGDWGKAFDMVIPKRKGGVLKARAEEDNGEAEDDAVNDENDSVEDMDNEEQSSPPRKRNKTAGSDPNSTEEAGLKADKQIFIAAEATKEDHSEKLQAVSPVTMANTMDNKVHFEDVNGPGIIADLIDVP